ncbi:YitT family protein [Clostridium sp. P21]|uniref:YitT family protein n=1 Tax=Clostridium muellerianum TaxID=2716538 RepID=A0A7Y0HMW3_9CLOT|nr:YitT family protein [Clostridium muellerianum]NMM63359.1 YitT family protein [Clostridium muellerianum]
MKGKLIDLSIIIFAIFLFSFALNVFFAPYHIVPGGVSGLAIVLESVLHIKKSIIIGVFNVPIFLLGLYILGRKFVINTALGAFLVPIFVELTSGIGPFTKDIFLATVLGGVITGVALGMLLSKQASVGGTDTIAKMISKFIHKPVGKIMICIDLSIVTLTVYVFGIEKALYGVVAVYIVGRVVDIYIKGFKDSKSVYVISDNIQKINNLILTQMNGRTTKLEARGGYTDEEKEILMCVITSKEIIRLKEIVREVDNNALVLVQDSYEVYGKGFSVT